MENLKAMHEVIHSNSPLVQSCTG